MSEIRFLESSLQKYLERYGKGELDDLLKFINEMIDINEKIKDISFDLEESVVNILNKIKEQGYIKWNEESEQFYLLDHNYIESGEKREDKEIKSKFYSILYARIFNPRMNLDLEKFNERIYTFPLIMLGELCIIEKIQTNSYSYTWDFCNFHINLTIEPRSLTIRNIPTLKENSPFFLLSENDRSLKNRFNRLIKIPATSGIYLFLNCINDILLDIDKNFRLKIYQFDTL